MPAVSTNDLKKGMSLNLPEGLFQVVDFQHVKPGKGGAFVRTTLRNMRSGGQADRTFRADEKLDQAMIDKRDMQFLYRDADDYVFMDNESYEQLHVPPAALNDAVHYIVDGSTVTLMMYGDEIVGSDLPAAVELNIAETEPGVQGDRPRLRCPQAGHVGDWSRAPGAAVRGARRPRQGRHSHRRVHHPSVTMSLATERRAARERALGLLYEAEAKGTTGAEVLAALPVAADDFAAALVLAVDEHRERIDALLERYAKDWTLARMPALDRAALRMGSAELIARLDVPTGVVLAETVELASRFSTDGSGRFVNGLLARVAQEVRPDATAVAQEDEPTPLDPQVDGLIIDLDGVIRHWDPQYGLDADERLGLPPGTISQAGLESERLARVVDGRLPFEAWCEEIGAVVADAHEVDAADVATAWATATWQIDLAVVELVEAARAVVPVALLSNASTHLTLDLEVCGIAELFDVVVGSADLGVAKPAPGAFEAALAGLDVAADRALFIDDTVANVDAASALGMRAVRFTGAEELRELLVSLDLIR